jgi:DNA repair protein RadD
MYTPFPTQQIEIEKIVKFIDSKTSKKGIFTMPVAFGKSIVIANVAMRYPEKYFINIAPNKELVKQNYEKYISYGYEASLCSASLNSNDVSKVTFATIGTLIKHADFFKNKDVVLLADECFPYDTYIETEEGAIKIGVICKKLKAGKEVPKVKSFNTTKKTFEYKAVTDFKDQGVKEVRSYNFLKNFKLKCTPNHRILTLDGWKEAQKLEKGDAVVHSGSYKKLNAYPTLNNDQFSLVIGNSLGDGNMDYRANKMNTARIKMIQGAKQKDYLCWKASLLGSENSVEKIEENGYSKTVAYRFTSPVFYFKEEIKNYKSQIDLLDAKALAILWMDDGNLQNNQINGRLYAVAESKELVEYLNERLLEMGIKNTAVAESKSSSTNNKYWYIRFRKQSLEDLFELCSRYIHKNLEYKVSDKYKKNIGSYKWNKEFNHCVAIYKNSEDYKSTNVYDITVKDNHNFVVTPFAINKDKKRNGGLVVHNCHDSSLRGGQLDKFVKKLKKCKVVGVTATPMRLNPTSGGARLSMMNRQFKCIYSTLESVVQVSDVIAEGRWSKLIYNVENVDETKLKLNTTGSDYTLESLAAFSNANNIRQKCVEAVYRLREEGRKSCIVYTTSIEEAEAVASKIDNAAVLHSKLRTVVRDRVIREFTSGRLQTVVNVGILKQGFDYPLLSSIVLARPTNSYTMYYQILGRAIRIHKDKKDAKIVDISGNYNKFGAIEDLEFLNADYVGGWAAFSGDRLLTDYALGGSLVPTKQSLKDHYKEFTNPSAFPKDPEFTFGKHKGTKVSIVKRNHEGYLFWMVDPKTEFNFGGKNRAELKAAIYRVLKLPLGVPVRNKEPF